MNIKKTVWQGVHLEAPSQYKLNLLRRNLKKVQKSLGFSINPTWVKVIRVGDTGKDTAGLYYDGSKMIKLDSTCNWSSPSFYAYFKATFLHEYVHAIDFSNNFEISKMFFGHYLKALKLIYKNTGKEEFNVVKKTKKEYFSGNKFIYVCPPQKKFVSQDLYTKLLFENGFARDYCLSDVIEFAATTMETYVAYPSVLNNDLLRICDRVWKQYVSELQ